MSTEDELRRCREILADVHARHSELTVQLRLQSEAAQHSERENLRLSRLLQEAGHDVSRLRQAEVVGRNSALSTVLAYIAGSGCERCSPLATEALKGQSS